MRDQIIADVPTELDQIRAQQMLFYDLTAAELMFDSLEEGKDFSQLASTYDPQTRGDLGWFPRGFLTMPELDPILFDLEAGETSDIIETEIGYHIIKVIEKQSNRPLDPVIRQALQEKALDDWLERRWKLSTIEITLP
jgi:parvulin-like peptidyl-prolyl isomerase